MMRRMLGAPLGGTTRGGHHGLESLALSLITPPNGSGGGGSCFPSNVTVAPGEPGTPVICWARTTLAVNNQASVNTAPSDTLRRVRCLVLILSHLLLLLVGRAALRCVWWELNDPLRPEQYPKRARAVLLCSASVSRLVGRVPLVAAA